MPLKNKTMALIRLRKTPYSGLMSFLQDVFYKQDELADKAFKFLLLVYRKGVNSSDWRLIIKDLFNVDEVTSSDERVIDEACLKYLGFNRDNEVVSKAKIRGRKIYFDLINKEGVDGITRSVLERASKWNSAVTSYYSVVNKLKAIGFIDKISGSYVKSDKFRNRFSQVLSMIEGFESEIK